MANSGYITSSGIQQVFTSGPNSGSVVTSSYVGGPTVNFNQNFISGTVDFLMPCDVEFDRYYQDLIACPINGCSPPILTSAANTNCNDFFNNSFYYVYYNSSSADALYTIVNYSTDPTFLFNTSSQLYNNSHSLSPSIDVSTLPYPPFGYSTIYFQAYNSCSSGATSSLSNIISASCEPVEEPTPLSISITNQTNYYLYYRFGGLNKQYALSSNQNTVINTTLSDFTVSFSKIPDNFQLVDTITLDKVGFNNGDIGITLRNSNFPTQPITSLPTSPIEWVADGLTSTDDLFIDVNMSGYSGGGTLTLYFDQNFPS